MKKHIQQMVGLVFLLSTLSLVGTANALDKISTAPAPCFSRQTEETIGKEGFYVYQNETFLKSFDDYAEALTYAKQWAHATLIYKGRVWHNFENEKNLELSEGAKNTSLQFPAFRIYQNDTFLTQEADFAAACKYAKQWAHASVYGDLVLWDNYAAYYYTENDQKRECYSVKAYLEKKKENDSISPLYYVKTNQTAYEKTTKCNHKIEGVPCIAQYPELPRGCEVTSLAMLLRYHKVDVSKMTLAKEINKISGKEDPNKGFIGDMYSLRTFGLGVYHSPIEKLAKKYVPDHVVDLTGCEFEDLYYYINHDKPIWVINNSRFRHLEESYFTYWNTPSGKIKITYKEHSVVIIGVDDTHVTINDPLTGGTRTLNKANFINGWKQMGRQCIIIDR